MSDILERLRRLRCDDNAGCNTLPECACVLMDEAADEIERLRAMLDPITGATEWWDREQGDLWECPEDAYRAVAVFNAEVVPIQCYRSLGTIYAAEIILSRDENGDTKETEVRLFRTRKEAEAALRDGAL